MTLKSEVVNHLLLAGKVMQLMPYCFGCTGSILSSVYFLYGFLLFPLCPCGCPPCFSCFFPPSKYLLVCGLASLNCQLLGMCPVMNCCPIKGVFLPHNQRPQDRPEIHQSLLALFTSILIHLIFSMIVDPLNFKPRINAFVLMRQEQKCAGLLHPAGRGKDYSELMLKLQL